MLENDETVEAINQDLARIMTDARQRWVQTREEILNLLEDIGPLRAGLIRDWIDTPMQLREIRPILRRLQAEGLIETSRDDPKMYTGQWKRTKRMRRRATPR